MSKDISSLQTAAWIMERLAWMNGEPVIGSGERLENR